MDTKTEKNPGKCHTKLGNDWPISGVDSRGIFRVASTFGNTHLSLLWSKTVNQELTHESSDKPLLMW